jgi:hypothetical protein
MSGAAGHGVSASGDPETGGFDESKFMLCFPDRDAALAAYKASRGDDADRRIGKVRRMGIDTLKRFVPEWQAGADPPRANGAAT